MEGIARYFARYQRKDGLLENVSHGWNLVDWPENLRDGYDFPLTRPVVGAGCHNVINALWYGFLRMKERMEGALGLPQTGDSRLLAAGAGALCRQRDKRPLLPPRQPLSRLLRADPGGRRGRL